MKRTVKRFDTEETQKILDEWKIISKDKKYADIIINVFRKYPYCPTTIIRTHYKELFNYINNLYTDNIEFSEKIYRYIHNINGQNCKICGKPTKFLTWRLGYNIYCSAKCSYKDPIVIEKIQQHNIKTYGSKYFLSSDIGREKIKEGMIKKYGVDNNMKVPEIKEKMKNTLIKNYGVDSPLRSDIIKNKLIQTNLKKYGTDCVFKNKKIKEKIKNTTLAKYGVENVFANEEIKEKLKLTMLKKYGMCYATQSEEIKNKIIQTNIQKYGVPHSSMYYDFREKIKQTNLKKYGVASIFQLKEIQEKSKKSLIHKIYQNLFKKKKFENVEILFTEDQYTDCKYYTLYPFKCKKCGFIFKYNLRNYHGPKCPRCFPNVSSIDEINLYNYILDNYGKNVKKNYRQLLDNKQEIDLYLPKLNLAIEFDGNYFHSEKFISDINYHLIKTNDCENKNIHLIHIFEHEWVDKKEIVLRKINNLLKLNFNRIYARNCEIKPVNNINTNLFLENNQLDNIKLYDYSFGLYYGNKLIFIMTFKKLKNNEYEIVQFCSNEYNVLGSISKLISYFIDYFSPSKLITYADRRYVYKNENVYIKLGFKLEKIIEPECFYFKKETINNKRITLFYKEKDMTDEKLKELFPLYDMNNPDFIDKIKSHKIWNCGYLKYVL